MAKIEDKTYETTRRRVTVTLEAFAFFLCKLQDVHAIAITTTPLTRSHVSNW